MATIDENALIILRTMLEYGHTSLNSKATVAEISTLSGVEEEEFAEAETYLIRSRLIEGYGSGADGSRWVSPSGVNHVKAEMAFRLSLSLDAEKILRHLARVYPPGGYKDVAGEKRAEILTKLNIDLERFKAALQELEDNNLAGSAVLRQSIFFGDIRATLEGRNLVRRNFKIPSAPSTQIGAIYQAPVNAHNVASGINSQVEQTVVQNDPATIQQAIAQTLDSLTQALAEILDETEQARHKQLTDELKQEITKLTPNPGMIQRLMPGLAFFDVLNGTWQFGEKFVLAAAVASPFIADILKHLAKLLGHQ